jgi:2-haloacid dehalogenase
MDLEADAPFGADRYDALTFDCYGTLVDWVRGVTAALRPVLDRNEVGAEGDALFSLYLRFEKEVESGPHVPYREVLRRVLRRIGTHHGFTPSNADLDTFAGSVGRWPPFPDTNEALDRLSAHFRLAVVSNVDDDLFYETARHFDVEFDAVVTGEGVGAYKPALEPFEHAMNELGVAPNRLLHVAQSVYHDVNPAGRLGLDCARVRRYGGRFDASPPSTSPVIEVPNLGDLAAALLPNGEA